jgi:hypothetical protein
MPGLQAAASFSSSPAMQERPQAAKQFMIPAPAEKKRIELYSPVSRTIKGYSISQPSDNNRSTSLTGLQLWGAVVPLYVLNTLTSDAMAAS